jgi:hypothetical protein
MNKFFVFTDGKSFIKISNGIDVSKTKNIDGAAYWIKKSSAVSWKERINIKFPEMEIMEAKLKINT